MFIAYTQIGDPPDRRQPLGNPEIKIIIIINHYIGAAMEKFGTTVGLPKREEKSVDGCTFTTGTIRTVFVNVVPKSAMPSTIVLSGSHMVQWYVQRFPIDRLRVRFPTIMVTHVFLLFSDSS